MTDPQRKVLSRMAAGEILHTISYCIRGGGSGAYFWTNGVEHVNYNTFMALHKREWIAVVKDKGHRGADYQITTKGHKALGSKP